MKILGILLLLLALFWFPPTRALILVVLPLGKGVDDFVFVALATAVGVYFAYEKLWKDGSSKQRFLFSFATTSMILLVAAWFFVF